MMLQFCFSRTALIPRITAVKKGLLRSGTTTAITLRSDLAASSFFISFSSPARCTARDTFSMFSLLTPARLFMILEMVAMDTPDRSDSSFNVIFAHPFFFRRNVFSLRIRQICLFHDSLFRLAFQHFSHN